MRLNNSRILFAAACLASLLGCAITGQANGPRAYQLTGDDEGFSIKFPDGKSREIVFAKNSDRTSREAMRVLRYSIFISTQHKPTMHSPIFDSAIFLVGVPGKIIPGTMSAKFTEGQEARVEFELKGWFIKVPYIEYPDVPDWAPDNIPRRLKRTTLEPKDFKEKIDPKAIHYDKAHRIYWIGVNPFSEQ